MTLAQFITEETGKKHLIPGQDEIYRGQCVQLIGIYVKEMYGEDLPAHPNAKDYWTYGVPGFVGTSTPQPGDIAVYDGHGDFPEGHIAIYVDGNQVFEENADPDGSPAHLANRANTYLLGYLRREEMATNALTDGEIIQIHQMVFQGENPPQDVVDAFRGHTLAEYIQWLNQTPSYAQRLAEIQSLRNSAGKSNAVVLNPGTYEVK